MVQKWFIEIKKQRKVDEKRMKEMSIKFRYKFSLRSGRKRTEGKLRELTGESCVLGIFETRSKIFEKFLEENERKNGRIS